MDSSHAHAKPGSLLQQQAWLSSTLCGSNANWKFVYMHHAPFSSGGHYRAKLRQLRYQQWGADAVFAGHNHLYERVIRTDGINKCMPYFVSGFSGKSKYGFGPPIDGSMCRYNGFHGAMLVTVYGRWADFRFYSIDDKDSGANGGRLIDRYVLWKTHK